MKKIKLNIICNIFGKLNFFIPYFFYNLHTSGIQTCPHRHATGGEMVEWWGCHVTEGELALHTVVRAGFKPVAHWFSSQVPMDWATAIPDTKCSVRKYPHQLNPAYRYEWRCCCIDLALDSIPHNVSIQHIFHLHFICFLFSIGLPTFKKLISNKSVGSEYCRASIGLSLTSKQSHRCLAVQDLPCWRLNSPHTNTHTHTQKHTQCSDLSVW